MGSKIQGRLKGLMAFVLAAWAFAPAAFAQHKQSEPADSLVRLVKGSSVQLIETEGKAYRKAVDATFLHNGTYLICDTALWNVDAKVIEAQGHVQVIQDETILTSDRLDYLIDESLAKFRGSVVQLQDIDRNTLRTRHLDYNTKDSTAVFVNGGSMRSHDGQIIESQKGTYDSQRKVFTFTEDVNMFTDSVFVKTEVLDYDTKIEHAYFKSDIDFWKDGNMLSSKRGWYDHGNEIFFFNESVHGTTEKQECWSDSLYFYRKINDVLLLGNAQIQDTTKNVFALADSIYYCDSISQVILRKEAAVALRTGDSLAVYDTLYFGADVLVYHTLPRCAINDVLVKEAEERVKEMLSDPVEEYRKKAAEEAAKAAEEARKAAEEAGTVQSIAASKKKGPGKPSKDDDKGEEPPKPEQTGSAAADSLSAASDSLSALSDSLAVRDSVVVIPDSTKVGFLTGLRNVRMFRKDIQAKADSLLYSDLDSVARFYIDPVIWNEGCRQYTADSVFTLIRGGRMDRASLMSSAFIITEEKGSPYFDQIKSTEVMAYFDTSSALSRFDALGGVNALFYLKEKEKIGTVNRVDSKMLSARFKGGEMDRVYYFDSPKNDAFPVVQLPSDEHFMRGFKWQDDIRPKSGEDITPLKIRPSERALFAERERGDFHETEMYFPGYMHSVYSAIAVRDSLKAVQEAERQRREQIERDSLARENKLKPMRDSIARADSLAKVDSIAKLAPVPALTDSLKTAADSLSAASDSLKAASDSVASKVQTPREIRKAKRSAKQKARQDRKEAKWKARDERDKAKEEARKQKALARKEAREQLILKKQRIQDEKDDAKREKFRLYYEKQKARKDSISLQRPSASIPEESTRIFREN